MELKTYKTAKGILNAAIRDIEAGRWCKGHLAEIRAEDAAGHGNLQDYVDEVSYALAEKPLGCALGLIAMHGGEGTEFEVINEVAHVVVEVETPTFESTPGVKAAVKALFDAIPNNTSAKRSAESHFNFDYDPDYIFEIQTEAIANTNDKRNMNLQAALEWFREAAKLA